MAGGPDGRDERELPYTGRTDAQARTIGGFMMLASGFALPALVVGSAPGAAFWLGVLGGVVIPGAAYFALGRLLRRHRTQWPAYGILALAGCHTLLCAAGLFGGYVLQIKLVKMLGPVAVFGLTFTIPLMWNAYRALAELRQAPLGGERGFVPIVPLVPIVPIVPIVPDAATLPPFDVQRIDSSR